MHPLLEKLTLAVPVYNDEKYLRATVESCVAQAGRVVICDNASTDGTAGIAAALAAKYPNVTHLRRPENLGAFENFKQPLFSCETEYFCWLGSHDLLSENYALPLLEALEKDKAAALAAGTIVHIDEQGKNTGKTTRANWANACAGATALTRVEACIDARPFDCFLFYGIFRAAMARDAWFDTPCLGFDRAMLVRTAARGNILYAPQSIFYARNLDKSRGAETDRDRRTAVIADKPLEKTLFTRNLTMAQTALDLAGTPENLTQALRVADKINRRYQSRRHYQKIRLAKIAGALILAAAFALALAF